MSCTYHTITCEQCDKEFTVPNWRHERGVRFCSISCKAEFQKGKDPLSKESRVELTERISGEKHWNYGNSYSDEIKQKLSEAHKGQKAWNKGKENPHVAGEKSNWYIHGLTKDLEYRSWQKNLWHSRKREARKLGTHTFGEWQTLKAQYGYTCPCCERSEPDIKLTIDHIIPVSKGGSDSIENIQPLCLSCNCKKHSTTIKY